MITITCPHCASRFRLPPELAGPGGARVRCARCEGAFDWIRSRPAGHGAARDVRHPAGAGHSAARAPALDPFESAGPAAGFEAYDVARVAREFDPFDVAAPAAARDPFPADPHSTEPDVAAATPHVTEFVMLLDDGMSMMAELESLAAPPAGVAPPPATAVQELDAADATPALVARLAVEELVNAGSAALLEAYDQAALFARFGPAIAVAWQHCLDRLGAGADPSLFRAALKARLGIDLPEWIDRG